jgi:predicted GNAT family N-acyltransferase
VESANYRIERARWPEDAADLRAVREAVFVREQGVPAELEWDGADPACLHWLARARDGRPIGTARLKPDGHLGRMAVLAAWRGLGVGSALLAEVLARARDRGLARVYLNAQVQAVPFYARHGFAVTGPPFEEAGIAHRRMALALAGRLPTPVL